MNINTLLPLTAATLFALCAGSMVLSHNVRSHDGNGPVASTSAVVDLPTVSVRPDPADLAYFQTTQARRVVDLPAVKVTPDLADRAYFEASRGAARIVTLATVTVRPAAADLAWYLSHQAGQVASVGQVEAQIVDKAAPLIRSVIAR